MTTDNLSATDFPAFFTSLWGKEMTPFQWQTDLAKRVLESNENKDAAPTGPVANRKPWPAAIGLPTASGKTACMDIAVFALAAQASRLAESRPITAPRRIFFVVDRRIIVDEAFERARRLARHLASAKEGTLKAVADALRIVAHGQTAGFEGEQPLVVQALRGGTHRSEAWVHNPLQPTIVATTVDQIGSRLLFRGYGRGSGVWPILAGLVANDSLILLDEAHCAQPFLQTLHAVRKYRQWAEEPLGRCFHPVVMSATPPSDAGHVFRDNSDQKRDASHPLGKRQLARKPAELMAPVQIEKSDCGTEQLAKALACAARKFSKEQRRAIVVFANRVATARRTHELLRSDPEVETVLLTGRMRSVDREAVSDRLRRFQLHSDQSSTRALEKPVVVVATQTLEVGADLDFDALVTECASLDALRQRFGRLNRMGRDIDCRAAIFIRADQVSLRRGDKGDPIYGAALTKTWKWLKEDAKDADGAVDFGIHAMEARVETLGEGALANLNAPAKYAPVMLPAHIDCWAQTAPQPKPSPDVRIFLRGPQQGAPDVQVCWRADIDLSSDDGKQAALESLSLCPPSSGETLPVPVGVFKRWLAGDGDTEDATADVPSAHDERDEARVEEATGAVGREPDKQADRAVVRWRGRQTRKSEITSDVHDIRPGDVVVIPTRHPGSWNALGDLDLARDAPPACLDVGDSAHRIARAKPALRLHKALVSLWPDSLPARAVALMLLENPGPRYEEDPDEVVSDLHGLLHSLADSEVPDDWNWLKETACDLAREFRVARRLGRAFHLIGDSYLMLVGCRRVAGLAGESEDGVFSDEDDASASGISHQDGAPVPLRTHLPGVEKFARRHALGCGLPERLVDAVALAGLLHDVGKADPRFQSLLRGGNYQWSAAYMGSSETLAKSAHLPETRAAYNRARESVGYPKGGRHELLSVRMAESASGLLPGEDDLRDLVLHLVASHHGHCRPFAPVVFDDDAPQVEYQLEGHHMIWCGPTGLERLDSGIAERYWRLTRRYGWWGLAWLEALLRLADWRRSEWEEANDAEE